ncbi:MAG: PorT family protein [Bacteroidales bacterium]|nr:PorT family protein [Bacteroidales bacterium]
MKKLIIALAALMVSVSAFAQSGIIAGVTSSSTELKDAADNVNDITLYHIGLTRRISLGLIGIQPSLIYNVKGTRLEDFDSKAINFKTGFLELPVQIQVGFPIAGFRPYAFVEPFLGYAITNGAKGENISAQQLQNIKWDNIKNRLEYGAGLGAGIDLFNRLQVSVRYFWNLGELYDGAELSDYINTGTEVMKNEKCSGIMASVAIFL